MSWERGPEHVLQLSGYDPDRAARGYKPFVQPEHVQRRCPVCSSLIADLPKARKKQTCGRELCVRRWMYRRANELGG